MFARRNRHELPLGDVSWQWQVLVSQTDLRRLWSELDLQVEAKLVARRTVEQSQLFPGCPISVSLQVWAEIRHGTYCFD